MIDLIEKAQSLKSWSIKHRKYLHQHAELSCQESQTAKYCKSVFEEMGYTIKEIWGYGFIADLTVSDKFQMIALRADMDALPIQEQNEHDFVSKNPGAAHMCGHDVHMTIALTAARILVENKHLLTNNVRFIFQPSEELIPGGAIGMIENGCLDGVSDVYGLHNDPGTTVGKIRVRKGPLMAAGDFFTLTITGRGGHAARPHDTLDPIIAAAQLTTGWQSIIARRINPAHAAVLSVCKLQAGDTFNVIADTAEMAGTVRTFDSGDRDLIQQLMEDSLLPLEKSGYKCDFQYHRGYDAVINHSENVERLVEIATPLIGKENIDADTELAGWAEDFAYYLQHRPGAFYFLGSGNSNITAPLHSAHFDVDDNTYAIGAAIMSGLCVANP